MRSSPDAVPTFRTAFLCRKIEKGLSGQCENGDVSRQMIMDAVVGRLHPRASCSNLDPGWSFLEILIG